MFYKKKREKQKRWQNKGWRKRNDAICGQYTNACKGGVQIKIAKKILKTIQVDHNNFNYFKLYIHFIFYVVETCSKPSSWFQLYIPQRFNISIESIACKPNNTCLSTYYHYVSHKGLKSFEIPLYMLLFLNVWFIFKCICVSPFYSTIMFLGFMAY